VSILATLAAAAAVAAAAPASGARAGVWVPSEAPVVVRGAGFRAHERVVVTYVASKLRLRTEVVAGADGTFVARWRRTATGGCHRTVVVAVGSRGSRASRTSRSPACPPPAPA
jgi:hypothetical protein